MIRNKYWSFYVILTVHAFLNLFCGKSIKSFSLKKTDLFDKGKLSLDFSCSAGYLFFSDPKWMGKTKITWTKIDWKLKRIPDVDLEQHRVRDKILRLPNRQKVLITRHQIRERLAMEWQMKELKGKVYVMYPRILIIGRKSWIYWSYHITYILFPDERIVTAILLQALIHLLVVKVVVKMMKWLETILKPMTMV